MMTISKRRRSGCDRRQRLAGAVAAASIGLSLSACSPVYETKVTELEPADAMGRICIQEARKAKDSCLRQSRVIQADCMTRQRNLAQDSLSIAKIDYQNALSDYRTCSSDTREEWNDRTQAQYEADLAAWKSSPTPLATMRPNRADYFDTNTFSLKRPASITPLPQYIEQVCGTRPTAPQLEDFVDASICGTPEASCEANYETAFRGCGGEIRREEICVKHCD